MRIVGNFNFEYEKHWEKYYVHFCTPLKKLAQRSLNCRGKLRFFDFDLRLTSGRSL